MLKVLPRFADLPIVRTRDAAVLAKCSIVVDVGGVYDAETARFDHHQASFKDTYDAEHTVSKLSSAGLVFKHYGAEIVRTLLGPETDDATVAKLVQRTYDNFVQELDAIDNGVEVAEGPLRYRVGTGLSSRVGRLNPAWNEDCSAAVQNARFRDAVALAGGEFVGTVLGFKNYWLPARDIVRRGLEGATGIHPSGAIVVMAPFCPWKDHLFELEGEGLAPAGRAFYALFQDTSGASRL